MHPGPGGRMRPPRGRRTCAPPFTYLARVSLIAEAWVFFNRLRRRVNKPSSEEWWRRRYGFVQEHAPGRSFADIGGLFQLHGEIAFRAEAAGASAVTLFDAGDEEYGAHARPHRRSGRTTFPGCWTLSRQERRLRGEPELPWLEPPEARGWWSY